MIALLIEFIVRTALIAIGIAVVLRVFRVRSAPAQHAAWTAVVVAMLCLPLALAGNLTLSLPVLEPQPSSVASTSDAGLAPVSGATPPVSMTETETTTSPVAAPSAPPNTVNWQGAFVILYLAGLAALMLRLVVGTIHANRLRRTAVLDHGYLTSERCSTPITVGWFAPALILPRGWQRWEAAKIGAVLTHEREHARRRDPLVQWLALLNRAVFWFHPLAWWLERRLASLAEEACDAAVIAAGHSPQDYSEYLLEMARAVSNDRGRVRLGMAMPGSGLTGRLRQILRGLPAPRLSRTRMACTTALCFVSSIFFAAGTPSVRSTEQVPSNSLQKFDVVSIRPCAGLPPPGAGRGQNPRFAAVTPGYAVWRCVTLSELANQAYAGADTPLLNRVNPRNAPQEETSVVQGGPGWIYSDRFEIEAKANGADRTALTGPMLRAMLADRFQLKVRRATEEQPMFALTQGSNTLKLTPTSAGECWERPRDWTPSMGVPAGSENKPSCGSQHVTYPDGRTRIEFTGVTMQGLAESLASRMVRYVVDRTKLDARFNVTLEYVPDDHTRESSTARNVPSASAGTDTGVRPAGVSIFKALQDLGLTLVPIKGPAEYLLVESAQRPKTTDAVSPAGAPPRAQGPGTPAAAPDGSRRLPDAQLQAQPEAQMQIKFEAVAIRPCDVASQGGGRGGGGGTSPRYAITPGYVRFGCATLEFLIEEAWGGRAQNALLNTLRGVATRDLDRPRRIRGGPSWIDEDRFEIEIRISGDTTSTTGSIRHDEVANAMAPALRAMLADRFQVKLRKETEQQPMYALSVAPGGHKLKPFADGDCVEWKEGMARPSRMGLLEGRWVCGVLHETWPIALQARISAGDRLTPDETTRPDRRMEGYGITLQALAARLASLMDMYVMDKSGVTGSFTFAFEYTANDNTPRTGRGMALDQPAWPQNNVVPGTVGKDQTIFKALAAVGLKLEPTRGPSEYFVVENAQRPK